MLACCTFALKNPVSCLPSPAVGWAWQILKGSFVCTRFDVKKTFLLLRTFEMDGAPSVSRIRPGNQPDYVQGVEYRPRIKLKNEIFKITHHNQQDCQERRRRRRAVSFQRYSPVRTKLGRTIANQGSCPLQEQARMGRGRDRDAGCQHLSF